MKPLGSDGWLTDEVVEAVRAIYNNEQYKSYTKLFRAVQVLYNKRKTLAIQDRITIVKLIVGEI